jgi:hypothetical protein
MSGNILKSRGGIFEFYQGENYYDQANTYGTT